MASQENGLDPSDWQGFRQQAHAMLDDMLDFTEQTRARPVWREAPAASRAAIQDEPLPTEPMALSAIHQAFKDHVLPFSAGNTHPGFMGWVQGGGTAVGMLAEMLAAGLNANLGGRNQMPILVERQITEWMKTLFGFPGSASGLFVTGTSMANLMAVLIARNAALGHGVRQDGLGGDQPRLTAYTSRASHGCVAQAMDLSGQGQTWLRRIGTNGRHEIQLDELRQTIEQDRRAGLCPFLIVGTAGSVDTGSIDDLAALAQLAREQGMWFHVDGAFGALGMLSPQIAPRLRGLEQADSIAFDFHKWGQVPYDAGFLLVRDGTLHHDTFAAPAAYLRRETQGISAGQFWPCDYGPDLSRGFRALKTWFTLKAFGTQGLGRAIHHTCELAQYLRERVEKTPVLELLAPVALNIVCLRHRGHSAMSEAQRDAFNADIVTAVQLSGLAAPSSTTIDGRFAIRAAIVNHRTRRQDIDTLVQAVLTQGARLLSAMATQEAAR